MLNAPVLLTTIDSGVPATGAVPLAVTTASITPSPNALLVACLAQNPTVHGTDSSCNVTSTGGLVWTRRARKNANASSDGGAAVAGADGGAEIWTAPTGSAPGAITVTATTVNTYTAGVGIGIEVILTVIEVTDDSGTVPTTGVVGNGSAGASSPSMSSTPAATSWIIAAITDWSAGGAGTYPTTEALINENTRAGQVTWHTFRNAERSAAVSTAMSITLPSTQVWSGVSVEIKGSSLGPGSPGATPRVMV